MSRPRDSADRAACSDGAPTICGPAPCGAAFTVRITGACCATRYARASGSNQLKRTAGSRTEPGCCGITTCSNVRAPAAFPGGVAAGWTGYTRSASLPRQRGGHDGRQVTFSAQRVGQGHRIARGHVERRRAHLEREVADGSREVGRLSLLGKRLDVQDEGLARQLDRLARRTAEEEAVVLARARRDRRHAHRRGPDRDRAGSERGQAGLELDDLEHGAVANLLALLRLPERLEREAVAGHLRVLHVAHLHAPDTERDRDRAGARAGRPWCAARPGRDAAARPPVPPAAPDAPACKATVPAWIVCPSALTVIGPIVKVPSRRGITL